MAKMIGKTLRFRQCPYECCGVTQDKHAVKLREKAEALKFEELAEEDHPDGLCSNGSMAGCAYCYGEDFDNNPPEHLNGIPNVLYNGKEPPSFDEI
jgi:hypothetical protein